MATNRQAHGRTVILAAGDFPRRGGVAWQLLATARRVVACDSAANAYRRRFGRWPDVIVGDMDSLVDAASSQRNVRRVPGPEFVRISEQETNDLEKAMRLCAERGWKNPVIVGAAGRREDHTIGNVYRALAHGLEIVSDFGRFVPVSGRVRVRVWKGAGISVFAGDPATKMTSRGLAWPLDGVKFANPYCATLNRAASARVEVVSDRPAYLYVAHGD